MVYKIFKYIISGVGVILMWPKIKLRKYHKNKKRQFLFLLLITILALTICITIYKTHALYEEEKSYNVIKGTIPDFGYDVKVAIKIDGQDSDTMPTTTKGSNGNYYEAKVDCGDKQTVGTWDYNAWELKLDHIETSSRCKVEFTSTLSKEDYEEYIKNGVATRRNTYRGKDITDLWKNNKLYDQIKDGTFADIYVGDYIKDSNNRIWLIADLDNYLYSGDASLNQHHATIIPAVPLQNTQMNDENVTTGGYQGSQMVTTTLQEVLETYIEPAFSGHIIKYKNLLTNSVDDSLSNKYNKETGASNNWGWYDRKLDLMSEVNVYGTTVTSSSLYDTGIDNRQYAIFQIKPEFINSYGITRFHYWLKDVTCSTDFAFVSNYGPSYYYPASTSIGVRPRFLIG